MAARMYVLSYDITDDRRRAKMHSLLESQGHRVQRSVFELIITPEGLEALLKQATEPSRFNSETDSLRCYPLCPSCHQGAKVLGRNEPPPVVPGQPLVF